MHTINNKHIRGISMIEVVIFIAIIAIAFTGVMVLFVNANRYSADPLIKIKTIELGQSLLEEIMLKAFDDKTPVGGGCVQQASSRCTAGPTASTSLQADEASRSLYDDVDDFHNLAYCGSGASSADPSCTGACSALLNSAGGDISANYAGFAVCIRVNYAGNELNAVAPGTGTTVLANDAKRIDVIITDPAKSSMTFSAYRLNF